MSANAAFITHSGYTSASVGSTEGRAGRTTAMGGLRKVRGGVCSSPPGDALWQLTRRFLDGSTKSWAPAVGQLAGATRAGLRFWRSDLFPTCRLAKPYPCPCSCCLQNRLRVRQLADPPYHLTTEHPAQGASPLSCAGVICWTISSVSLLAVFKPSKTFSMTLAMSFVPSSVIILPTGSSASP